LILKLSEMNSHEMYYIICGIRTAKSVFLPIIFKNISEVKVSKFGSVLIRIKV
jgi:hypothetical protein